MWAQRRYVFWVFEHREFKQHIQKAHMSFFFYSANGRYRRSEVEKNRKVKVMTLQIAALYSYKEKLFYFWSSNIIVYMDCWPGSYWCYSVVNLVATTKLINVVSVYWVLETLIGTGNKSMDKINNKQSSILKDSICPWRQNGCLEGNHVLWNENHHISRIAKNNIQSIWDNFKLASINYSLK